ncbi:MAG: carboxymuconolactone decarboxylase family protein [Rhizobium sp.]|nr:carboxymuconolactone decarboxylase family protein [Rhizobium sp.]
MNFNMEPKLSDKNLPAELSPTQQAFGTIAPKFAQLSEDVLFADVWERPQLSKRDRSLITVAALTALYRLEQLPFHLERAQDNGLSREELAEAVTHLAFYAGWPAAASALKLLEKSLART